MPVAITFRTTDSMQWGSGLGHNLTAAQIDQNFWNLKEAVDGFTAPAAITITSVTVAGAEMTFHMSDASTIGPIAIPVLSFRYLGAWQPFFSYNVLDTFFVVGVGIFTVEIAHTSGASFDPNIMVAGNSALLQLFGAAGTYTLSELKDVSISDSSLAQDDFLVYDAGSNAAWTFRTVAEVKTILGIVADDDSGGSGGAVALAGLVDVTIDSTVHDGQVLTYSAGKWVPATPSGGGGGGSGAVALAGLIDVAVDSTLTAGWVLTFNGTHWVGQAPSGGGADTDATALAGLSDVSIDSTLVNGAILIYEGGHWIGADPNSSNYPTFPVVYVDRGAWDSGAAYSVSDYVQDGGASFLNVEAISAPASTLQEWSSGAGMTISTTHTTDDTATSTATSNAYAIGSISKSAGKWIYEFETDNLIDNGTGVGITTAAGPISGNNFVANAQGQIHGSASGSGSGSFFGIVDNNRGAIAVDFDGGDFWVTNDVTASPISWNGSTSNAPGGSGGVAIGSMGGASFPCFYIQSSAAQVAKIFSHLANFLINPTTLASYTGFHAWETPGTNTKPELDPTHWVGQGTSEVLGTTTNDNAAAGYIGEYIEDVVLIGSPVGLTTATAINVASIVLTAGDWDVWGTICFDPASTAQMTAVSGAISQSSGTFPTAPGEGAIFHLETTFAAGGGGGILAGSSGAGFFPVGMCRISLSGSATIYLVGESTFTVAGVGAYGMIAARRAR